MDAYVGVQHRLSQLLGDSQGAEPVPGCPAWTVRDVVAHLTGLCQDWVEGRLDGYASDAWTANQVDRFASAALAEILDVWRRALDAFVALDDHPVMGPPARWAFGDAVVHEADVREAIGGDNVPLDAVALALKGQIARWRQVFGEAGVGTLHLRCPDLRDWWLGEHDDPHAVVVEAPAYEVFRALAGRRTTDQVRGWAWSSDPDPFIAAGLPYPFTYASS